MNTQFIYPTITAIAIFQSFFYFLLLLKEKSKNRSNLYLGFLVLSLGLSMTFEIIYPTGWYENLHFLIKSYVPSQFLIGPFLFFYIRSLTSETSRFRRIDLIHFLPFIAVMIYLAPFFLSPVEDKIEYARAYVIHGRDNFIEEWIIWLGMQTSLWVYGIKSLLLTHPVFQELRKKKDIRMFLKNWQLLLYFAIFLTLLLYLAGDIMMLAGCRLCEFNHTITLILTIMIMGLGLVGMNRMDRVTKPLVLKRNGKPLSSSEIMNQITEILNQRKYYLDPELTLEGLAKNLEISRTELSKIINQDRGINFYDYINSFRTEEFINRLLLEEYRNRNILDIAFDAGFNSKSTFNRVFKEQTGKTPLQYKKDIAKISAE